MRLFGKQIYISNFFFHVQLYRGKIHSPVMPCVICNDDVMKIFALACSDIGCKRLLWCELLTMKREKNDTYENWELMCSVCSLRLVKADMAPWVCPYNYNCNYMARENERKKNVTKSYSSSLPALIFPYKRRMNLYHDWKLFAVRPKFRHKHLIKWTPNYCNRNALHEIMSLLNFQIYVDSARFTWWNQPWLSHPITNYLIEVMAGSGSTKASQTPENQEDSYLAA